MPVENPAPRAPRILSVDILRGAVMVFMALDHVRDFTTRLRVQPEAIAQHGSVALFATRWITHFCAPSFALLAGLGIGLSMQRGKSRGDTSRFLVSRGLWLIVLDLVITPVFWRFSLDIMPIFALVLWALGISMIVLAGLIHLPRWLVTAFALALIAGHNLLDGVTPERLGHFGGLWHVLHVPGFAIMPTFFIAYPLIPWIGVMALGWVMAACYGWTAERRRTVLLTSGVVATLLFIALRTINGYGDPRPWTHQATFGLTIASFLNAAKYPPSLDFLLMTLGPATIALALLERARGRIATTLAVFGSVPMFYYVVHIPLVHLAGVIIRFAQSGEIHAIPAVSDPSKIPTWYGVGLPGVYVAWAAVVLAMYPLCRWYGRLKRERPRWWYSYL